MTWKVKLTVGFDDLKVFSNLSYSMITWNPYASYKYCLKAVIASNEYASLIQYWTHMILKMWLNASLCKIKSNQIHHRHMVNRTGANPFANWNIMLFPFNGMSLCQWTLPEQKWYHSLFTKDWLLTVFCKQQGADVSHKSFISKMTEIQSHVLVWCRSNFYCLVMHTSGINEGGTKGVLYGLLFLTMT